MANDKDENFAKLREKLEAKDQTIEKLKHLAVNGAVAQAGLDPSKPLVGLVTEKWQTEVGDDIDNLTPDNFLQFAEPFELGNAEVTETTEETNETDDEDDDLINEIEAGQSKGDKANEGEQPSGDEDPEQKIQSLQKEGNFEASFHEKLSQLPGYADTPGA